MEAAFTSSTTRGWKKTSIFTALGIATPSFCSSSRLVRRGCSSRWS